MPKRFNIIEYVKCVLTGIPKREFHDPYLNGSPIMTWCDNCGKTIVEDKVLSDY